MSAEVAKQLHDLFNNGDFAMNSKTTCEQLQQIARDTKHSVLATSSGLDESTISRFFNNENSTRIIATLIAEAGYRIVPQTALVVDADEMTALKVMALKYLMTDLKQQHAKLPRAA